MNRAELLACPECDLLQCDSALPRPRKALCSRCGAILYQRHDHGLDRTAALSIAALVYVTVPLRYGHRVPHFGAVFRLAQFAGHWAMVEVFVLGVLVAWVRLDAVAEVEAGLGIWSFAALMLVMATIEANFDPRELWARAAAA